MEDQRHAAHPNERGDIRTLEISGTLSLFVDGDEVRVRAADAEIVAELPPSRGALGELRAFARRRRAIGTLSRGLHATGLTLIVRRDGRAIARLGAGVSTTVLGRLFGIERASFFPGTRRS